MLQKTKKEHGSQNTKAAGSRKKPHSSWTKKTPKSSRNM